MLAIVLSVAMSNIRAKGFKETINQQQQQWKQRQHHLVVTKWQQIKAVMRTTETANGGYQNDNNQQEGTKTAEMATPVRQSKWPGCFCTRSMQCHAVLPSFFSRCNVGQFFCPCQVSYCFLPAKKHAWHNATRSVSG